MKSLNALVGPALTGLKAPSMPDARASIERIAELENAFAFRTLRDPILERILCAAWKFSIALRSNQGPHWLSLLGNSGIGKTHLAKQVYRKAKLNWRWYEVDRGAGPANLVRAVAWVPWRELSADFKNRDFSGLDDIFDAWFCVLDDIGADYDPNGLALSCLDRILDRRLGKWTLLTSNLGLEDIESKFDPRVASRMMRGNSKVFQGQTVDYSSR